MFDFEQLEARPQNEIAHACYDRWLTPEGEEVALFHRTGDGFLVRFSGKADFTLPMDDRRVACTPAPDIPDQIVIDLFYNQIVPLLLNFQGELVFHASGIATKAGALAFLGQSGRGKSTLAAYFANAGYPFLTDDGLLLKRVGTTYTVNPNRPYLRLWSDSDSAVFEREPAADEGEQDGKALIDAGPSLPFQDQPLPLAALYLLGPGAAESVVISRLNPALALSELIKHSFILDVDDRPRLRAHFDRLVQIAEAIDCFTLDYPRQYEALPEVIAAVLEHVQSGDLNS